MARSGSRLDPPLRRLLGFVCALVLLTNLAWAAGHAVAASASGALAEATSDTVPYLLLTLACLATLAGLLRAQQLRNRGWPRLATADGSACRTGPRAR